MIDISYTMHAWCKAIGIQEKTLAIKLTKAGHNVGKGKITAKQIVDAVAGEKDAAMVRNLDAKTRAIEQKEKMKDGTLVEIPVAERILWAQLLGPLKQEMDAMPQKLAILINPDNPSSAREILFNWAEDTKRKMMKQ